MFAVSSCRHRNSQYQGAFTPSNGIKHLRSTSTPLNGRKPWPFSWTAAVAQHFLMSAAARTLSLVDLCDLSEDAAHKMLCAMRWPDTEGAPICPNCNCVAVYTCRCRRVLPRRELPTTLHALVTVAIDEVDAI